jgi:hypothetical protein
MIEITVFDINMVFWIALGIGVLIGIWVTK